MTLAEIKDQIMFQTNNDAEDIEDYLPHAVDYINDGYDRMVKVWTKSHAPQGEFPWLVNDEDVPMVPEWTHRALCDWATWLMYRNGNPQKQQRGRAYYENFMMILSQLADEGGAAGIDPETGANIQFKKFRNIPV